ncbi:Single-stranded DNA-binding protein ssb [compost metagenome]
MRNYENNEGKRVYVTEVIADNVRFLESNREGGAAREEGGGSSYSGGTSNGGGFSGGGDNRSNNSSRNNSRDPFQDDGRPIDISEDDLPF